MKDVVITERKWVRSEDGWFAGVCEGLANRFGFAPNLIRLIWLFSVLIFGSGLFVYIILSLVLPREDRLREYDREKLLGVCYKLSVNSGLDLGLIRLLAVISLIASFGTTSLVYLIMFFFIDENPPKKNFFNY